MTKINKRRSSNFDLCWNIIKKNKSISNLDYKIQDINQDLELLEKDLLYIFIMDDFSLDLVSVKRNKLEKNSFASNIRQNRYLDISKVIAWRVLERDEVGDLYKNFLPLGDQEGFLESLLLDC